jgi:hypothetical protein
MALATIQFFGEYLDCQDLIFPGFAGTPARLTRRVSCFLGVRSPNRRDSPDVKFPLVRDSRQRGGGVVSATLIGLHLPVSIKGLLIASII